MTGTEQTDQRADLSIDELRELQDANRVVIARLQTQVDSARQRELNAVDTLQRFRANSANTLHALRAELAEVQGVASERERSVREVATLRTEVHRLRDEIAQIEQARAAELETHRTEVATLRDEIAAITAERDSFRSRLQSQYDLRWTRIGGVLRSARSPAGAVKLPVRLVRELRRRGSTAGAPAGATTSSKGAKRAKNAKATTGGSSKQPKQGAGSVVKQSQELVANGEHEEALALVQAAVIEHPRRADLLEQERKIHVSMGELSAALATSRRMIGLRRTKEALGSEAALLGRLRDLDPNWYPDLGAPESLTPNGSSGVLHLLKESLPYHERGYTMRSRYALVSQRNAGLEPSVVTSLGFPRLDGHPEFEPIEMIDDISHHRLDLGSEYPYRRIPFDEALTNQAWLAADAVRSIRPSVIHANSGYRGYDTAVTALALRAKFGIPVVYDVRSYLESTWTGDISRSERGEHYEKRIARENRCMTDADLVFTIAHTMRDEIVGRGIDPDKVIVIPNAVDPDQFVPLDRDAELAQSLGLDGKIVLGYVSNIGHREGIDVLVRSIAELRKERDDVGCLVVGEGPELDGLRELRSELGLDDCVVLTGQVPHSEVHRYYSLIDVFVVPRRDDRAARLVTPLKPFEAMAMELPIVVSDLPALSEVAAPGERGLSFVPEDPASLAATVAPLLDDPALRARFGAAGRDWVQRERTWAANGKRYVEAYGRVGVRPQVGA